MMEDQSPAIAALNERNIASTSIDAEYQALVSSMGLDEEVPEEKPIKVQEQDAIQKWDATVNKAKEIDAKAMSFYQMKQDERGSGGLTAKAIKNVPIGMAEAVENTANLGIGIADGVEDFLASYGYGTGELITQESRIQVIDKMFPTDDPADKAFRMVGQYVVPLAGWMRIAKLRGWSNTKAIISSGITSAAIQDPTDGRLTDFLNEFPRARGFVVNALLSEEDDSELAAGTKTFFESVVVDSLTLGVGKAVVKTAQLFGDSISFLRGLKKIKPAVEAADSVSTKPPPAAAVQKVPKDAPNPELGPQAVLDEPALTPKETELLSEADEVWRPAQKVQEGALAKEVDGLPPGKMAKDAPGEAVPAAAGGRKAMPEAPGPEDMDVRAFQESMDISEVGDALKLRGATLEAAASKWARRGKITDEQAQENARQILVNQGEVEKLFQMPPGTAFTEEQALAIKYVVTREVISMSNLITEFGDMSFKMLNDVEKARFIEQYDRLIHSFTVLQGAMAEGGRTLRAFGISDFYALAPDDAKKIKLIQDYVESAGDNMADVFNTVQKLNKDPKRLINGVGQAVRRSGKNGKINDMLYEAWLNGVLGVKVLGVNVIENRAYGFLSNIEKGLAAAIGALRGTEDAITFGEVFAEMRGQVSAIAEAFRTGGKVFREGEMPAGWLDKFPDHTTRALNGPDMAWLIGMSRDGTAAKVFDKVGTAVNVNLTSLKASDAAEKVVQYRGSLAAQAYKASLGEGLEPGTKAFNLRAQHWMENPTDAMLNEATKIANENTFTSPLVIKDANGKAIDNVFMGRAIDYVRSGIVSGTEAIGIPVLGKIITSFANIGGNLTDLGLQRVPFAGFLSPRLRNKWNMGGRHRDEVISRMTLAGMGMSLGAWAYLENRLTDGQGRNYRNKKAIGGSAAPPYSILINDQWVSYKKGGVIGNILGMSADTMGLLSYVSEDSSQEIQDLMWGTMAIIASNVTPEILADAMGDAALFLEGLPSGDFKKIEPILARTSTGFIPHSSNIRDVQRVLGDKFKRDTTPEEGTWSLFERMKNEWMVTMGWGEGLPKQYNIWGEEQQYPAAIGPDIISPIYTVDDKTLDSVDRELMRLGMAGPIINTTPKEGEEHLRLNMPMRQIRSGMAVIPLSPKQYEQYVLYSAGKGDLFEERGIPTLKEALALEIDNGYPTLQHSGLGMNDHSKKLFIQSLIGQYRTAAGDAIQSDIDVQEEMFRRNFNRRDKLMENE